MSSGGSVERSQEWRRVRALLATFVGTTVFLAGGMLTVAGCSSSDSQAETDGMPPDEIVALAGDLIAANNAADKDTMASFYAEDAVLDSHLESPPLHVEGRDEIARMTTDFASGGSTFGLVGQTIQVGDYVIQPVTFLADGERVGQGVHVFLINKDNQVAHHWLTGGLDSW